MFYCVIDINVVNIDTTVFLKSEILKDLGQDTQFLSKFFKHETLEEYDAPNRFVYAESTVNKPRLLEFVKALNDYNALKNDSIFDYTYIFSSDAETGLNDTLDGEYIFTSDLYASEEMLPIRVKLDIGYIPVDRTLNIVQWVRECNGV